MKTKILKTGLLCGVLVSAFSGSSQVVNWVTGGNALVAGNSNNLGTTSGAVTTRRTVNLITNSVTRVSFDGASFLTQFRNATGGAALSINGNTSTYGILGTTQNLGLFAGTGNLCEIPGGIPPGNVVVAGQTIFMQPKNIISGGFAPTIPPRVVIGENTTTFVPNQFTPKLLVRGNGLVSGIPGCVTDFNDADNIGLVSEGTFGESPASANANRWISLGSRPTSTTNVEYNAYGYRAQWNNYAGDLVVQNRASGTIKDISLTWQDGTTTTAPNTSTFSSNNGLLIQFRNGSAPASNTDLGRRTVAKFTVVNGNGQLDVSGLINANAVLASSDARLKKDVTNLINPMVLLRQLRPVTYNFKRDEYPNLGLPTELQYGFIAQEMERVLPTHVGTNSEGYKAINYIMLIPLLTKALQDYDVKVSGMENQLNNLTQENQKLNEQLKIKGVISNEEININDLRNQFFQNTPNPFNELTTISYAFKNNDVYKMIITDLTGKIIKTFTNLQAKGEVKISKEDLPASGVYLYSIVTANGEIAATKQMILEK
jgi:hypothetical protein